MADTQQQQENLQTVDEAFGSGIPTVDDAFGPETSPGPKPIYSGPIADSWFGNPSLNFGYNILSAFGQGVKEGWGNPQPTAMALEAQKGLENQSWFKDNILNNPAGKAFNEAFIRPAVLGLADVVGYGSSAFQAYVTGVGEAAIAATSTVGLPGLGREIAGEVERRGQKGEGLGLEDYGVPKPITMSDINTARAEGIIGEGTHDNPSSVPQENLTPTQIESKNQAVANLPQAQPAAPDIHQVARTIAPEVFNEYDIANGYREYYRNQLNELQANQPDNPRVAELQGQIDTILGKVNGVEDRLTNAAANRLEAARSELADTPKKLDTPEMAEARQNMMNYDYKMRDLAPDVSSAYRMAQEQMGSEAVASNEASPEVLPSEENSTRLFHGAEENSPPASGGSRWFSRHENYARYWNSATPKNVWYIDVPNNKLEELVPGFTGDIENGIVPLSNIELPEELSKKASLYSRGENTNNLNQVTTQTSYSQQISSDVSKKLINAGRPSEEAQAASELVAAYYETRSQRFGGAKGNPYELYAQESPNIRDENGNIVSNGETLEQSRRGSITLNAARNTIRLFKNADASTFIHETGHQWLEDLMKDAQDEQAPQDLIQDSQSVKDWLGVKEGENISRAQHEKFARGFERYMMEGIAPSANLANVFAKFKNWLTQIYQTVSRLRSPITDDIRSVFDRMLTTNPNRTVVAPERPVEAIRDEANLPSDKVQATPTTETEGVSKPEQQFTAKPSDPITEPPKSQFVDKAGNIRLDLLASHDDVNQTLKQIAEQNDEFLAARRGNVTNQDIIDFAEAAGLKSSDINIDKLRNISLNDEIPLAARIYGGRQMLIQSAKAVWDTMHGDDEIAYATARDRHIRIQETLAGITAEWGRAGQAFKMMAEEAQRAEQLGEFFQSNLGKTLYQIKQEMKAGKLLDDPSKVSGFINDVRKPSLGDMALELFRNWLISGPITHLTYATGNKLYALYKAVPETAAKALVGDIKQAVTGKIDPERARWGEIGSGLYAMFWGQKDGLKASWDSFKAGQTVALPGEDAASTYFTKEKNIPGALGPVARFFGERMVAPIHSFDRTVGYLTNRAQLIYRQAVNEGLSGQQLKARIAELERNTPEEITKEAVAQATEQALMGKPGELTRRALNFLNWETDLPLIGHLQPMRFMSPFVSVVSNINRMALMERSPLGLVSKSIRDDVMGRNGSFAQDSAIAKIGLGTAFAGTVGALAMEGLITPSADPDYKKAKIDEAVYGAPHSIRIGDMSYQLDRLGVLGTLLGTTVDLFHAAKEGYDQGDYTKAATLAWHSITSHLLDEGFMSGISDVLKAIDEPERYGQSWAKNFISEFAVPFSVGSSQIARIVDPYQRDARGILDGMKAKIPFLSEELEPRVDVWGQPVPNKEYYGVYAEQLSNDPVTKALENSGYFPAPVRRQIKGVQLTDQQYFDYATKAGMLAHTMLAPVVQSDTWNQLSQQAKHDIVKNAISKSRQSAAAYLMMKPENSNILKEALDTRYQLAKGANK